MNMPFKNGSGPAYVMRRHCSDVKLGERKRRVEKVEKKQKQRLHSKIKHYHKMHMINIKK